MCKEAMIAMIAVGGILFSSVALGENAPLRSPFLADQGLPTHSRQIGSYNCPTLPTQRPDLGFQDFYRQGSGSSVIDPNAMAVYRSQVGTVRKFERQISNLGDDYLRWGKNMVIAHCLTESLHRSATAKGFLGAVSRQGGYVRKWVLATVASSYQKFRRKDIKPSHRLRIEDWLHSWTKLVIAEYSDQTPRISHRNNHLYWAAWAVTASGVALNHKAYLQWGLEKYKFALSQIQEDGSLPLELARQGKARHYHLYAIGPLVMIAETAAVNRINIYGQNDGALHRLVKLTLASISKPGWFEAKTGYHQSWVSQLGPNLLAWLVPYLKRFPNESYSDIAAGFRPMKSMRLGGDLSLNGDAIK